MEGQDSKAVLAIDAMKKSRVFLLCAFISCSSQHEHAFTAYAFVHFATINNHQS